MYSNVSNRPRNNSACITVSSIKWFGHHTCLCTVILCTLLHISMLLLLLLFRGSAVMCRVQAGESLLKRGNARTWEPPVNPPFARHGTFAEQGPPTLKACNREQTQQRSCLHRTHHLGWPAHLSHRYGGSAEEETHGTVSEGGVKRQGAEGWTRRVFHLTNTCPV